jgi:hypothetical protein
MCGLKSIARILLAILPVIPLFKHYLHCEGFIDIIFLGQIGDILAFRTKVSATGFNPSESVSEAICKELYPKCFKKKNKSKVVDADL